MSSSLERDTEDLGVVRLCRRCGEEWPRDTDFWYFSQRGKVLGSCRACWSERPRVGDKRMWGDRLPEWHATRRAG